MATFTNQATLSYNNVVRNSNVVSGELLEVLTATKASVGGSYAPGEVVPYVITIVNTGNTPFTGITVSDDLGAYLLGDVTVTPLSYVDSSILFYANGVLQATPTVDATGDTLEIGPITVPANGNVTLVFETIVGTTAPGGVGGTITNTATIDGAGLSTPIAAADTLAVREGAELTISKAISPAAVVENGEITYTFVIQNSGNTAAVVTDNIVVTDTFDPILSNITVTLDGAPLTVTTDYTYNEATGEFATVAGRITVPAATYTQDAATGVFAVDPGVTVLTVTGTV